MIYGNKSFIRTGFVKKSGGVPLYSFPIIFRIGIRKQSTPDVKENDMEDG